jgi:hypothetical protein
MQHIEKTIGRNGQLWHQFVIGGGGAPLLQREPSRKLHVHVRYAKVQLGFAAIDLLPGRMRVTLVDENAERLDSVEIVC